MSDRKSTRDQQSNLIFRKSDNVVMVISSIVFSIAVLLAANLLFFYFNPSSYIDSIRENLVFNFLNTSIVFLGASIILSYFLSIESEIQFKNKKFYYNVDSKNYQNVLLFPVAIAFGILITIFFSFTLLKYIELVGERTDLGKKLVDYRQPDIPEFSPTDLLVFFFPFVLFVLYFVKGYKKSLLRMLLLTQNIKSYSKDITNEIYLSRLNNTELWLIIFRISNFADVLATSKKSKKYVIKNVVKKFRETVRGADFVIPLDYNDGIIGYIIHNEENEVDSIISQKMKPYLEDEIRIKNQALGLKLDYEIEDLRRNENINTVRNIKKFARDY